MTHIVTSTALSGSKTHALQHKMRGWKPAVVRPEWVLESVRLGRRAAVGQWSVLQASSARGIFPFLKAIGQRALTPRPTWALAEPRDAQLGLLGLVVVVSRGVDLQLAGFAPSSLGTSSSASRTLAATGRPAKDDEVILVLDSDDE